MVNVPPIPPLLCSTPPPIDFGDEDDECDVLPPALGGDADEDFGDFLAVDDSKSNESLPSPRPPSVTDLPPMSIYDGFLPPTNGEQTNNLTTVAATASNEKNKSPSSPALSKPIVEAFNYNVTTQQLPFEDASNATTKEEPQARDEVSATASPMENNIIMLNASSNAMTKQITNANDGLEATNSHDLQTNGLLEMEKVADAPANAQADHCISHEEAIKCKSKSPLPNRPAVSPLTQMVSIEDLEDDLSEDELYSPRTPKNFIAEEGMTNYFEIQEIEKTTPTKETANIEKEAVRTVETSEKETMRTVETKTIFEDGSKTSASSNVFTHRFVDTPPPLDDLKNIAVSSHVTPDSVMHTPPPLDNFNDNDSFDDFGDFADFQDFPSVTPQLPTIPNIPVPVNDNKTYKSAIESDDEFEDFVEHNNHDATINETLEDSRTVEELPESQKDCDDITKETSCNEDNVISYHLEHDDLNMAIENDQEKTIPTTEQTSKFNNNANDDSTSQNDDEDGIDVEDNNDDDFGDFADFEQQPVSVTQNSTEVQTANEPKPTETKVLRDDGDAEDNSFDDEEDDFGDFNTAEPVTKTAPIQTSQSAVNTTNAPLAHHNAINLNQRISKVLQIMFTPSNSPPSTPDDAEKDAKLKKIQDIPFTSIDAAKALEYQWLNSETRHSFIKSLGIDSRNILYGENWNPSLPRFAANLSFNPLKPMKPVTSNSSSGGAGGETISASAACPAVESIAPSSHCDNSNKSQMNSLGSTQGYNNIEIDWKSSVNATSAEQASKAFEDNSVTTEAPEVFTVPTTCKATYLSHDQPESLTIFTNEDKLSHTPPISEMEAVNTFTLQAPTPLTASDLPIDIQLAATQIVNEFQRKPDIIEPEHLPQQEEEVINDDDEDDDAVEEVVTSTTFTGVFKETHIYTPPKTSEASASPSSSSSTSTTSPSKAANIDFDYEKAAMGVIIDETVVKKEYRDIEYNSPFSMDALAKPTPLNASSQMQSHSPKSVINTSSYDEDFNDEFSDFQCVTNVSPAAVANAPTAPAVNSQANFKSSTTHSNRSSPVVPAEAVAKHSSNVSACGMILSPAILIPQAISMESQKPKIEWGDSTSSINPEELARIEELFPEPKSIKSSNSSSSQKTSPIHQANPVGPTAPSISAAVASKELGGTHNDDDDDDDWSDFVSVPATNNNKMAINNNLVVGKSPSSSPFRHKPPQASLKMPIQNYNNTANDDEWSDFVSSAPQPPAAAPNNSQSHAYQRGMPQFNSGAWQNANFYNNPLSLYHKGPLNVNQAPAGKNLMNNNNNYTQYNQFQAPSQHAALGPGQQIHIMQNFSTAPVPLPERHNRNAQFQVGSAKVAPSIALIPDLGFVAPAIPTHTSFINSLPKPSLNSKK